MIDLHRLAKEPKALFTSGVVLAAIVALIFAVVIADFSGAFSRDARLRVQLPVEGSVVSDSSPVTYRGVEIGQVERASEVGEADVPEVVVRIDRDRLAELPRNVRGVVGPVSIFGNQYVQLEVEGAAEAPGLADGDVVAAASKTETPSLQTTFVALDDVLQAVDPAKLNAGLSGLSGALEGEGQRIGKNFVDVNGYLDRMIPLWPTFVLDLDELSDLSAALYADTPAFLSLIENAVVTSETILERRSDLRRILGEGGRLATSAARLTADVTASYADTVDGAATILDALSQQPQLFTRILVGVDKWARTWAPVLADGEPDISVETLTVKNPANLALAMVAGGDPDSVAKLLDAAVGRDIANPPTYSGCPDELCNLRVGGAS